MAYRAVNVASHPLDYFLQDNDEGPRLRVADVVLRANQDPKEVFARLIRFATNSHWSHAALLYLLNDPLKGFDNTFIVEAMTTGVRVSSWEKEIEPPNLFTVAIKRMPMDWYVETPAEAARHDPHDREDAPGIDYLRHVRGMALDQIDCLYDHNVVDELAALYVERVVKRHLGVFPQFAEAADALATYFRNRDTSHPSANSILRFICSGLVQYSFFEALRRRIIHDLTIPEHRDAAMSNLNNLHRIIFHPDPEGVIDAYIQQVKSGTVDIHTPVPQQVLDLIKTTTPSDFNNSSMLEWRYVIRQGVVWKIEEAPADYKPQSEDEEKALELLAPEHSSFQH